MPDTGAKFVPKDRILSFEEIHKLARLLVQKGGIRDIRITGGEPLVRQQIPRLIEMLAGIEELEDLSLTTNGMLLADQAQALRQAGQLVNLFKRQNSVLGYKLGTRIRHAVVAANIAAIGHA